MTVISTPNGFVDVSPEQAQQYEDSKQEAAPQLPTEPSVMIGTDGKQYNVPASSYQTAIEQGWKPASTADIEKEDLIRKRVSETGQLEGGLKSFGNEATMGIANYISNKEAGPEQAAIDEEVRNRIAERDPITNAVAKTAGFVAPLLIPGVGEAGLAARGAVLGTKAVVRGAEELAIKGAGRVAEELLAKEATASLTRKIAATAADYAAQGAVYSAPKTAVQVAYGDVEQAAETMAAGIGLSALAGAGAGVVGAGISKVAGKVDREAIIAALGKKQANGITHADNFGRVALGITDKQALKLGPDKVARIVDRADQLGILSSGKKAQMFKQLLDKSGKNIGEHLDALETHLSDPEMRKLLLSPIEVSNEFQTEALKRFPEMMMETHAPQLKEFNRIVSDIGAGGSESSFKKLQSIRQGLSKGKKAFDKTTPQAQMYQAADNVIKKNIEQGAQQIYNAGKEPTKFADYLQNKFDNHMSRELLRRDNPFKGTGRIPNLESLFGHGSSVVNVGMAVALGHPGVGLGTVAAKNVIKHILKNEAFIGKGISIIRKISKDPTSIPILGGLLAKEGQSSLTAHLDSIPSLLTNIRPSQVASNAIVKFLGNDAVGLSKEQQFKKISEHISSLSSNENITSQQIGDISGVFAGTNIQLASLIAQKKYNAIEYLNSQLPKNPTGPQPFEKDTWKANRQDQLIFERKLSVVMNPMQIWNYIQDGSITSSDVETLKVVYPKMYNAMVEKVVQTAYDPRTGNVPYKMRMAASVFTGLPLDSSLKNLANIQEAIKPQETQGSNNIQKPSKRPKMDKAATLTTDVQRRTYGQSK